MIRMLVRLGSPLVLIGALACSGSTPQSSSSSSSSPPPSDTTPAPSCAPTQYVAGGQCFDDSSAACATLSCPSGCRNQETAPAIVVCNP